MRVTFGKYLHPSPVLRELLLLDALCASPRRSQVDLGADSGVTPAMVNAYLARFQAEGLITKEMVGREGIYHVSDKGKSLREYHLISYLAELSTFAVLARDYFLAYFRGLAAEGLNTIICYGAGETALVATDALRGTGTVRLLGLVDDDPAKQGTELAGYKVTGPQEILRLQPDAVIVTSWRYAEEILARLSWLSEAGIQVRSLVSLSDDRKVEKT